MEAKWRERSWAHGVCSVTEWLTLWDSTHGTHQSSADSDTLYIQYAVNNQRKPSNKEEKTTCLAAQQAGEDH